MFCYLLEVNVYDGYNISSLQRYVMKRDTPNQTCVESHLSCYSPNDSVLNNLISAENVTIGISQLYHIWGDTLTPHILQPKGIDEMPTPLHLPRGILAPSILSKPYFLGTC